MHKLAKLFLPLLVFLAASAHNAEAVNTIAVNPASYSVNENAGQVGVIVSLTRDAGNTQVVSVTLPRRMGRPWLAPTISGLVAP